MCYSIRKKIKETFLNIQQIGLGFHDLFAYRQNPTTSRYVTPMSTAVCIERCGMFVFYPPKQQPRGKQMVSGVQVLHLLPFQELIPFSDCPPEPSHHRRPSGTENFIGL